MNLSRAEQIAKAVLYEGYMLYPYRPSSVKNQQRWNFGVLYPQAYSQLQDGDEAFSMRTECLICGTGDAALEVRLRFLHLRIRSQSRSSPDSSEPFLDGWQEAVERDVGAHEYVLERLCRETVMHEFTFPSQTEVGSETGSGGDSGGDPKGIIRRQLAVEGVIEISAEKLLDQLFKVTVCVRNLTPLESHAAIRDQALLQSLVSTHTILAVRGGEFVSLLDPLPEFQDFAGGCRNVGAWPVLVGEPGQRDTLLASPIILYDYPQIAPESVGDLFDGTEIDEILSLRIMTLTDEEKREIRQSDERARQILERTETMPAEQFMKLHGAVRGLRPLKEDAP